MRVRFVRSERHRGPVRVRLDVAVQVAFESNLYKQKYQISGRRKGQAQRFTLDVFKL